MRRVRIKSVLALGIVVIAVLLAASPAEAQPPTGKRFAGVLVLKDPQTGVLEANRACLKFNKNGTFVTNEVVNGVWEFVPGTNNKQIKAELLLDFGGVLIPAVGIGVVERTGTGSSIGGIMVLDFGTVVTNVAFGGTQAKKRPCLNFAASDSEM